LSALVTCVLILGPSQAAASEKELHVSLHYEVEASTRGCWDEVKFRRGVAHRIGYDPFQDDAPLNVKIHIGGSALAVDGHVEWREASGAGLGERTFVAKDGNCGKLMTEMSFAVGLQIEFLRLKSPKPVPADLDGSTPNPPLDPTSVSPSPNDESAPTPPETQAPPPEPAASTKPTLPEPEPAKKVRPETPPEETATSPSESSPRWSMWAGVGPSLAWRLSPGITADGRLFLGLRRRDLSFELGAEATYPSTFRRWDGSGFRHTLIGASLAFCGHIDWFSACALGRASQVRITGLGVNQPRSPNGFAGQAGARLAATLHVAGAWSVATHIEGLGLLTSSRVALNQSAVWEMPRLGMLAGIDVLARFR
jgi:hypothetical protein